jgi:succinate dehydrogenase / fumarate reductase cytochrome b subunit
MLSMMMSIVHRITGAALYVGTLLLVWWLLAAVSGPGAYAAVQSAAASFFGRIVLFGYTWALIHHMLGGMRYLIWDTGRGFGAAEREWLVRANLVGSILLTIILWVVGGYLMGGLR